MGTCTSDARDVCINWLVYVAGPAVWKCAVQFACNAVNSHAENADVFWEEFCPVVR